MIACCLVAAAPAHAATEERATPPVVSDTSAAAGRERSRPAWLQDAKDRKPAGSTFSDRFGDGREAPTMVVVPAGRFLMGSPANEPHRRENEGPHHEVSLRAFALGRTEVSRAQFAAFVRATGYVTDAERDATPEGKTGWTGCTTSTADDFRIAPRPGTSWRQPNIPQRDDHPVVCVSWNDANAYIAWLSRETGASYRLPSEAEFEYAARAGAGTPWPWGADPDGGCATGNGADESGEKGMRDRHGLVILVAFSNSDCDDGHDRDAPVGSLRPNAFGLHDMIGNVYEWTADCYAKSYFGAPTDGSARPGQPCNRPTRGGAWSDEPAWLRAAVRIGVHPVYRNHNTGFRVARDLGQAGERR